MSADIRKLHAGVRLKGAVDQGIVDALEEFLKLAKDGQLRNVAIAAIDDELCAQTVYLHSGRSVLTLCGALGMLTRRVEQDADD